jgi:hypothetical protein
MKRKPKLLHVLTTLLLCGTTALPCTTFVLRGKGKVYFGRNLDWSWEEGLVITNPLNVQKTAFLMTEKSPVTGDQHRPPALPCPHSDDGWPKEFRSCPLTAKLPFQVLNHIKALVNFRRKKEPATAKYSANLDYRAPKAIKLRDIKLAF